MKLDQAKIIADNIVEQLAPHSYKISIAGSIRREKPDVKDIEIVLIPKPYQTGLFEDGLARIVNQWQKVKGELVYGKCKYTQRILPEGIKLDLFFAMPMNYGLILAMRTGSAEYSHKVLGNAWVKAGYKSIEGVLTMDGRPVYVAEETDLFKIIGLEWIPPERRNH